MQIVNKYIYICIFLILILIQQSALAQFSKIRFQHLTAEDGLSTSRILCIFRDSQGFVWLGTDMGVNKFDGQNIKIYENEAKNANSLSNNYIVHIFEDSKKQIWISTNNGLNLYNRETDNFTRFLCSPEDSHSISCNSVRLVFEDSKNNIWIATTYGLNKWIPEKKNFKRYYLDKTFSSDNNSICSIVESADGKLWLGTYGHLWSFSPTSEKFRLHINPLPNFIIKGKSKILALDKTEKIWIGAMDNGLFCFDIKTGKFSMLPPDGNGKGTNGLKISDMYLDENKYLYMAIDYGGLNRLNLKTMEFEYCIADEKDENGLNNNGVCAVYKDKEGILYVGTSGGGLNIHNPKNNKFITYRHSQINDNSLIYNVIRTIYEDSRGLIWIGTSGGGLSVFNPRTKTFTNYKHTPEARNSLSSNAVLSITEDKDQNMWIATWGGGLNKFDFKNKAFTVFKHDDNNSKSILSNSIYQITTDVDGNLWLMFQLYGIQVFNEANGVIKSYKYNPNKADSLPECGRQFFKTKDKKFGIATEKGFCYFDFKKKAFTKYPYLNEETINDVLEDKLGNLWVSTSGRGVFQITPAGETKIFDKTSGFPSNTSCGILEDKNGNIWISTFAGISNYSLAHKHFINYTLQDGLQGRQFTKFARCKASDGAFYFGGSNGLNVFYPDSLLENNYLPCVYITDFQIFNKSIATADTIILTYKESVISFSFNAINLTYPQKAMYAYKMDGYDNEWNYTDNNRKYATYTNLNPGSYTFLVKASNNDGVWNETPTKIHLIILPPFWKTIWFRLIAALFLSALLFSYYYFRVNRLRKQKAELEQKVTERTYELQEVNIELEEKQQEIIIQNEILESQREELESTLTDLENYRQHLEIVVEERTAEFQTAKQKAEESDKLKSSFLANLSHEIRTPLNAIAGFTDLLLAQDNDMEAKQFFRSIIHSNTQSLLNLINDILDFSMIEAGQLEVKLEPIDLNILMVELREFYNLEIETLKKESEKEISLQFVICNKLNNKLIITDKFRLKQIFQNIINNAIKFTEKGTVESGCTVDETNKEIKFYVKDNGIGIKKENQDIIFKRFRKLEDTQDNIYRGAGLGLSICKHLVKLLGGRIWVESEFGKGSIFWFTIPLETKEQIYTKTETKILKPNIPDFSNRRFLIAEDNESNFLLIKVYIKKTGAEIDRALNGKEAVTLYKENPTKYDLVIMDLKMPEMDGFEAINRIRLLNDNSIVIAHTAHAYADEIERINSYKFNDILLKPLRKEMLYETLRKFL